MERILRYFFSKKTFNYICISSIFFLLGFSIQRKDFIKSKIKNFFLESYYKEIKGPRKVVCPQNSLVIAYFGQSNSAGYVKPLSNDFIPDNLIQFDWRTGECYEYKEPLLGSEGRWGNSITHYALLLAKKVNYPVIIVPFGKAGSSISLWSDGYLFKYYELVLQQLKIANLTPNIFLWHQGENDSRSVNADMSNFYKLPYFSGPAGDEFTFGTSTYQYQESLSKIIAKSKKEFPNSYFGVALVSRCGNNVMWESIRKAQENSARLFEKVFISADSDSIYGSQDRYDGCHFSRLGAKKLSEMYFKSTLEIFDFSSIKIKN